MLQAPTLLGTWKSRQAKVFSGACVLELVAPQTTTHLQSAANACVQNVAPVALILTVHQKQRTPSMSNMKSTLPKPKEPEVKKVITLVPL